jgi:excisionase family DNA binding protein
MNETYLTPAQVAERLQVPVTTVVRYWIGSGRLQAMRAGRTWRISESALQEFLQRETERVAARKEDNAG